MVTGHPEMSPAPVGKSVGKAQENSLMGTPLDGHIRVVDEVDYRS